MSLQQFTCAMKAHTPIQVNAVLGQVKVGKTTISLDTYKLYCKQLKVKG